jgi:hypothetical protein
VEESAKYFSVFHVLNCEIAVATNSVGGRLMIYAVFAAVFAELGKFEVAMNDLVDA